MPILTQVNLGGLLAWEFLLMHWVEVRRWQVIAGNSTGEASKSGSEIFFVTALLSERACNPCSCIPLKRPVAPLQDIRKKDSVNEVLLISQLLHAYCALAHALTGIGWHVL